MAEIRVLVCAEPGTIIETPTFWQEVAEGKVPWSFQWPPHACSQGDHDWRFLRQEDRWRWG